MNNTIDLPLPKQEEIERIITTTVIPEGPPKTQKVLTDFFLLQQAIAKKKLQESTMRRRERGSDWYSKLRKTPYQLKLAKQKLKRERFAEELREKQEQIARIQTEYAEARAEAEKVALEQDMIRRQDKKDRKVALGLYKKTLQGQNGEERQVSRASVARQPKETFG